MAQTQPAEIEVFTRPPLAPAKLVFFWTTHSIAVAAAVGWYLGAYTVTWPTVVLAFAVFVLSTTSIGAGYHRLFSHATYEATWPLRLFYLVAGGGAVQGSAMQWGSQHRDHHTFCDGEKDPYNIKLGFWYAHMGWVVRRTYPDYERVTDLERDTITRWQHQGYGLVAPLTAFGFPALIGSFWGEAFGAFMVAGVIRLVIQWHMTFCVNSVAHQFGHQKYSVKHTARGNWWFSFLVWGEMDHNFHHSFPNDFRTGTNWYDFDPSKWFISVCSVLGLARKLRRADPEKVERAKERVAAGLG
jgi:stearoyl-CoA desaturase (delta-9 desaturase)